MINKISISLLLFSLFLSACNQKNYLPDIPEFNKCFGLNFSDDFIYSDTIVKKTVHENKNIYTSLNDSLYEWSIARGEVEYVIDTFYCDMYKRGRMPVLYFESENYIIYSFNCGSPCWYYDIYNMQHQEEYYETGISFFDTTNFQIATIVEDEFIITNFKGEEKGKYEIKGIYTCLDNALPLLHLNDFYFEKNMIKYEFSCVDGSEFIDTIHLIN